MGCKACEVSPVTTLNGQSLCGLHAEQWADVSARETPPIARTRHVPMHPQSGASQSGTPRHYK